MEDAEAEKRRKTERQRERRAERIAAGLCYVCGKARESTAQGTERLCGYCAEKKGESELRRRARKREKRAAERGEVAAAGAYTPRRGVCPYCHRKRLVPHGRSADGRGYRYRCEQCGRTSTGIVPLTAHDPQKARCPFCGGPCQRFSAHLLKSSGALRQRYRCTVCGKYNTDLYPEPPKRLPGEGVKRHTMAFYLNPSAQRGLIEYCNARRMSAAQAIREIFRRANAEPVVRVSTGRVVRDWDGSPRVIVTSPAARRPTPEEDAELARYGLPDLRPGVMRARMRRRGEHRHAPTVLVSCRVCVRLDDAAKAGLLKEMRRTGRTHQEAARGLLSRAMG
jgi:Zinc ribbon domain.